MVFSEIYFYKLITMSSRYLFQVMHSYYFTTLLYLKKVPYCKIHLFKRHDRDKKINSHKKLKVYILKIRFLWFMPLVR